MIWDSWSDFFSMGGYAQYVWGSVVVVFGFMATEVVLVKQREKSIRAQLSKQRVRSKQ